MKIRINIINSIIEAVGKLLNINRSKIINSLKSRNSLETSLELYLKILAREKRKAYLKYRNAKSMKEFKIQRDKK